MGQAKKTEATAGSVALAKRNFTVAGFAPAVEATPAGRVGKELRKNTPRSAHAEFAPAADRPSVVDSVESANEGRIASLIPIRVGRMAVSPFAFLRGSAGLMATDLAATPNTGLAAQLCGDAHAANFGVYGGPDGQIVIDINDFDETVSGPWEWDLKRLAASLVVAGREVGASKTSCFGVAFESVGSYRKALRLLASMPVLDAWRAMTDEKFLAQVHARQLRGTLEQVAKKARRNTSATFAADSTVRLEDGRWRFVAAPPVLTEVSEEEAAAVVGALTDYVTTVAPDRQPLLGRFAVHDAAFRVVGTGSVGLRSYVVLLRDHLDEPLVLQVKEARASALLPYLPRAGFPVPEAEHEGRRVVLGQKRLQTISDGLLGWTTAAGRPFQVRQFRNRKGSVDLATLRVAELDDYARICGALLARMHAHSVDPRVLAGYCGKNEALDEAAATFAVAYADQTERDHADLGAAIRVGRIPAETG
jgi:uncharacterized protein (DUF2252 family)